jgi:alpha-tubulin suppressor-like RCC1 family protein
MGVDASGDSRVVIGVNTGINHTIALTSDGGVWCWGYNTDGQVIFIHNE